MQITIIFGHYHTQGKFSRGQIGDIDFSFFFMNIDFLPFMQITICMKPQNCFQWKTGKYFKMSFADFFPSICQFFTIFVLNFEQHFNTC